MSTISFIFELIQTLSAEIFLIRMSQNFIREKFFEKTQLTKIGTIFFVMFFLIQVSPIKNDLIKLILNLINIFVFYSFLKFLVWQRERAFQSNLIFYLERLKTLMSLGYSMTHSLDQIIELENGYNRAKLMQIRAFVVFSQHKNESLKDKKIWKLLVDLSYINKNSHQAQAKLQSIISHKKIITKIRRKSGQLLYQLRLQSIILTGLYIALVCFVVSQNKIEFVLKWIILGTFLFLIGIYWLFKIGKNFKWKI